MTMGVVFISIPTNRNRMTTRISNLNGDLILLYDGELVGARLIYLNLQLADLRGLLLEAASFIESDLTGADLSDADVYWGWFSGTNLTDATLRRAKLCGADFTEALLIRADLSGADLGTDNVGGSARLEGADLSEATFDNANFRGATYDGRTRFPKGFSPVRAGIKLTENPS